MSHLSCNIKCTQNRVARSTFYSSVFSPRRNHIGNQQIAKQDLEDHFGAIVHMVSYYLQPPNDGGHDASYCKAVCVIRFGLAGTWRTDWRPRVLLQTLQRGHNAKSFSFRQIDSRAWPCENMLHSSAICHSAILITYIGPGGG